MNAKNLARELVSAENDVESKDYMSNEDVLKRIQEFAISNGRLPEIDEPGIEDVINVAKKVFGSLENALRIAGLLPGSRINRQETLTGTVMRLLDWNPMTLVQIREEVRKVPRFANTSAAVISHAVYTSQNIVSIGPRRQKIYFLEGQEEWALAKEKNSSPSTNEFKTNVHDLLASPMTKDQLERLFSERGNPTNRTRIKSALKSLLQEGLITRAAFFARAHGSQKYSAYQLFGPLACKTYFYRTDSPEAMVGLLSKNLNPLRVEEGGFKRSLTIHLRQIFPENILRNWKLDFDSSSNRKRAIQDPTIVSQSTSARTMVINLNKDLSNE